MIRAAVICGMAFAIVAVLVALGGCTCERVRPIGPLTCEGR